MIVSQPLIYRALALLSVSVLVSACVTVPRSTVELICTVEKTALAANACTSIPTLTEGVLELTGDGSFELKGRYESCYQVEDNIHAGTYLSSPHENGIDLELYSLQMRASSGLVNKQPRTIGLINLDTKTLEARFTDTAAVIRSRGQLSTPAPSVVMMCVNR